jgi:predicted HD phosphohydrolase
MEVVFSVSANEFDEELFEQVKSLLKRKKDLSVTISITEEHAKRFLRKETRDEYFERLNKAIENLNNGYGKSFNKEELEDFSKQLLNEP